MKRFLALVMLLSVFAATPAFALGVGDTAPEIKPSKTWNDDGVRKNLSDFKGEYTFVIFWATW